MLDVVDVIFFLQLCFNITGVTTGNNAINGHISQIPGLSPTIGTLPEDRARGRRAGVLESDSEYVKLAKQGGHKGRTNMQSAAPAPLIG